MVSVLIGSAVAALAFTGANYGGRALDRLIHGDKNADIAAERKRHDLAMEAYEKAVAAYNKKRQAYRDWLDQNYRDKMQADKNFQNTDYAFKLYAQTHPHSLPPPHPPRFKDYYTPSQRQKNNELMFLGISGLAIGGAVAYYL